MPRKPSKAGTLTHIDSKGEARMVDVSAKPATERVAVAEGRVVMRKATLELIVSGNAKKGDTPHLEGPFLIKRSKLEAALKAAWRLPLMPTPTQAVNGHGNGNRGIV